MNLIRSIRTILGLGFVVGLLASMPVLADQTPECLRKGQAIPIDDQQVINWKNSTPNQFLDRAHVQGTITRVFPDKTGHAHFEIKIGNEPTDVLEVIYNQEFGKLSDVTVGATVEACGDYITSNKKAGGYEASPSGAIIHWVHFSKDVNKHASGFVVINGNVFGAAAGK